MKKIESVYKRMLEWKNAVSEILKKVCETNPEELWKLEQTLYELFLQSLWLPTAHPEGEVLKRLLQIMRKEM